MMLWGTWLSAWFGRRGSHLRAGEVMQRPQRSFVINVFLLSTFSFNRYIVKTQEAHHEKKPS
jgi:hypothetical protein